MENFNYLIPTKVIFGKGEENNVGAILKEFGATSVLIYYGGQSAKRSGLLDRVFASVEKAGIKYVEKGGVQPNPRLALVNEGVALAKANNVDFILAVGGGSTIDTSKATALALGCGVDDAWDIYTGKVAPTKCLPIGSILTISAAGSETSNAAVITNDEGGLKRSCRSELLRPRFAIMNPELTFTLPKYQRACGIVDIMMHTLERYFPGGDNCRLTDAIAEGVLKTVAEQGIIACNEPDNYDAQAEIMWAGSLSHNNLTGLGKEMDFATHQIEHELSGMFDVSHGAGLASLWGSWARYVCEKVGPEPFARYAVNVWGCRPYGDQMKTALAGIRKTEEFFLSLGMPIRIRDLGVGILTAQQIDELAEKCTFFGKRTVGSYMRLGKKEIMDILEMAK